MRLPNTIRWRDFSAGNIQKVSSDINVPNSVPFSMNLLFDKVLGEAVSRQGTNIVGSQLSAGATCQGIFQHLDSDSDNNKLFAGFNGNIYDVVAGTVAVSGLSTTAKMHFATFLNTTIFTNGVAGQARSYTAAGGWVSTGGVLDVGNIPSGADNIIEFKDRLYASVTDRLYYTNTPTAGSVSWTASGSGSLQAEQEDGGGTIEGLNKVPGYITIFKKRSLKRWNFDSSFPESLIYIGTDSQESILTARGRNYFFYNGNFYETDGGYPKLISRPVKRVTEGIASSFYGNINGWSDNENVYWSIGDITINFDRGFTESYANCVLVYTIDTQQWSTLRYAHEFRAMSQYISVNDTLIVGGDIDGQVLQINHSNNTDYPSTAISYILESPELDFSKREKKKTISEKIYVHSDISQGALLMVRLDYGEWKSIGSIKDIVSEIFIQPLTAFVFQFRVVDSSVGEIVKIRGLDFPNVFVFEE